MESNVEEETIRKEMNDMCLLLENDLKRLEREWQVKKKKNFQFEQQCSELRRDIIIFKGEEASDLNKWDVIGIRECGVEVKILEENQITQEEQVESVHSINENLQIDHLDDQVTQILGILEKGVEVTTVDDQVINWNQKDLNNSSNCQSQIEHQVQLDKPGSLVWMHIENGKLVKSDPKFIHQNILLKNNSDDSTSIENQCLIVLKTPEKDKSSSDVVIEINYKCRHFGCVRAFTRAASLANHRKVHLIRYKCQVCQESFTFLSDFQTHLCSQTNPSLQPVNEFEKFENSNDVSIQIDYRCQHPECGKSFKHKKTLSQHQNIHLNKYQCRMCQRSFETSSLLQRHLNIHTGERRFACGFIGCDKRFSLKGTLKQHIKIVHLKKRPFQCNKNGCGKSFSNNNQLEQHSVIHSSARPFPCQVEKCGWRAKRKSDLARHVKDVHSDVEFKCDIENCQKSFKRQYQLKYHQSENHEEQRVRKFACTWIGCKKRFSTKGTLKFQFKTVHLKERPFICKEIGCKKSFRKNYNLKQHLKQLHSSERPIQCQFPGCDKRMKTKSNLTKHMKRVHLDLREFRCDFDNCQKAYKCRRDLLKHQQKHY